MESQTPLASQAENTVIPSRYIMIIHHQPFQYNLQCTQLFRGHNKKIQIFGNDSTTRHPSVMTYPLTGQTY